MNGYNRDHGTSGEPGNLLGSMQAELMKRKITGSSLGGTWGDSRNSEKGSWKDVGA